MAGRKLVQRAPRQARLARWLAARQALPARGSGGLPLLRALGYAGSAAPRPRSAVDRTVRPALAPDEWPEDTLPEAPILDPELAPVLDPTPTNDLDAAAPARERVWPAGELAGAGRRDVAAEEASAARHPRARQADAARPVGLEEPAIAAARAPDAAPAPAASFTRSEGGEPGQGAGERVRPSLHEGAIGGAVPGERAARGDQEERRQDRTGQPRPEVAGPPPPRRAEVEEPLPADDGQPRKEPHAVRREERVLPRSVLPEAASGATASTQGMVAEPAGGALAPREFPFESEDTPVVLDDPRLLAHPGDPGMPFEAVVGSEVLDPLQEVAAPREGVRVPARQDAPSRAATPPGEQARPRAREATRGDATGREAAWSDATPSGPATAAAEPAVALAATPPSLAGYPAQRPSGDQGSPAGKVGATSEAELTRPEGAEPAAPAPVAMAALDAGAAPRAVQPAAWPDPVLLPPLSDLAAASTSAGAGEASPGPLPTSAVPAAVGNQAGTSGALSSTVDTSAVPEAPPIAQTAPPIVPVAPDAAALIPRPGTPTASYSVSGVAPGPPEVVESPRGSGRMETKGLSHPDRALEPPAEAPGEAVQADALGPLAATPGREDEPRVGSQQSPAAVAGVGSAGPIGSGTPALEAANDGEAAGAVFPGSPPAMTATEREPLPHQPVSVDAEPRGPISGEAIPPARQPAGVATAGPLEPTGTGSAVSAGPASSEGAPPLPPPSAMAARLAPAAPGSGPSTPEGLAAAPAPTSAGTVMRSAADVREESPRVAEVVGRLRPPPGRRVPAAEPRRAPEAPGREPERAAEFPAETSPAGDSSEGRRPEARGGASTPPGVFTMPLHGPAPLGGAAGRLPVPSAPVARKTSPAEKEIPLAPWSDQPRPATVVPAETPRAAGAAASQPPSLLAGASLEMAEATGAAPGTGQALAEEAPPAAEIDRSPEAWYARLLAFEAAQATPPPQEEAPGATGDREEAVVSPASGETPRALPRGPDAGGPRPIRPAAADQAQPSALPEGRPAAARSESSEPSEGPSDAKMAFQDAPRGRFLPPAPLAESTQQFLRPLVGIDPASVRVHRGAEAELVTVAHAADALTVGDSVALGAAAASDTPQALGLLAHELTHVARGRAPRFVPPVALPGAVAEQAPGEGAPDGADGVAYVPPDEEALARRVEARVTMAAERRGAAGWQQPSAAAPPARAAVTTATVAPPPAPEPDQAASSDWGGLPAPWEPLPAWLWSTPASESAPPAVAAARPSGEVGEPTGGAGLQRAEPGRQLESIGAAAARDDAAPQPTTTHPEPDLDALARQVYSVLKRRLALERRRAF